MTSYDPHLDITIRRTDVALRPFRTPIRGHAFSARPPGADDPHAGMRAEIQREPTNPADPLAVAVWAESDGTWWRLGYLDRGVAGRLAPRLDRGLTVAARVDGWVAEPRGRWRRPVVLLLPDEPPAPPRGRPRLAAEDGPPTRLWGRPPGSVVRPARSRR